MLLELIKIKWKYLVVWLAYNRHSVNILKWFEYLDSEEINIFLWNKVSRGLSLSCLVSSLEFWGWFKYFDDMLCQGEHQPPEHSLFIVLKGYGKD